MKKLKKNDMKKIALLGIASGAMLSGQAAADQVSPSSAQPTVLAAKCGNGCGNKSTAYRASPSSTNMNRQSDQSGQMPESGKPASGQSGKNYVAESCNAQRNYVAESCNAQRNYVAESCRNVSQQNYVAGGCRSVADEQRKNYRPSQNEPYTQWETADNSTMKQKNAQGNMNWNGTNPAKPQGAYNQNQKQMQMQNKANNQMQMQNKPDNQMSPPADQEPGRW